MAVLGALFFVGGIVGGNLTMIKNVKAEDVWLTTEDGVRMHGRLFTPDPLPAGKKLPGVVFTHGFMTSLESYELPYGYEIARRGFAVLAIDYRGHGDTGGYIQHWTKTGKKMPPEQPEVARAVKHLRSLSYVDPERIGLAGHSMGGRASTCQGFLDPTIKATISIGFPPFIERLRKAVVPVDINEKLPKNFLMIIGDKDFIYSEVNARKSMLMATSGKFDKQNRLYGAFEDDSAREFRVIEGVGHVQEGNDPAHIRGTIRWLEKTLMDKEDKAEIPLSFQKPLFLFYLALLGVILGATPFCAFIRRRLYKDDPHTGDDDVAANVRGNFIKYAVLLFAGTIGSLALYKPLSDAISHGPVDVPLATANWILGLLWGLGAVLFAMFFVAKWVLKTDVGLIEHHNLGRGALFAVLAFVYYFAAINLAMSPHVFDLSPTGREFGIMVRLFAIAVIPMYVISLWIFKLGPISRPKGKLTVKLSIIVFVLFTHYAVFGTIFYPPEKEGLMVMSIFILSGIMLTSLQFIPGMASRKDPWPAAIFMSLFFSWLVGVIYPFVQT